MENDVSLCQPPKKKTMAEFFLSYKIQRKLNSTFQDGVFRMSLSPDGALLAVIHFSGRLSVWDVPSLRQRAAWNQDQQVAAKFSPSSVEQSRKPCVSLCVRVILRETVICQMF